MSTKLGTLTLDLVARIGNFTTGMRQASSSAEREMGRASSSVNVMNGMLGKLAATAGAAFSINQIKNYADSYTGIVNKLKIVTNGQTELNTAMADTYKIAQATASSWGAVNDVYSKYMGNATKLNLTQEQTARLTEITSKAVAISGSTTEAAAGALFQYGQALDGNILRGEEFNSLVDGAGGLLSAMAKGLGVTRGELRQMMLDGKLTGEVITKALLKAGDSVDELYSKTDTTMAASLNLITTEATKMVGEFDAATGASKTFVTGITSISENMNNIVSTMGIGAAFMAGTYIPAIYGTAAAGLVKTKQMVDQTIIQYGLVNAERAAAASSLAQAEAQLVNTQTTLAALAAEKALEVQRLQAQITAAGRMATTTRMAQLRQIEVQVTAELTAAETALAAARTRATAAAAAGIGIGRTTLGILGGPVGMGITLAAVAAGYLLMKGDAEKATTSIEYQGQKLEDLVVKYRELSTLQRDNETKALADQVQDLAVKFRVASSDLSSFMQALPASDEKIDFFVKLTKEYQNGKISSDAYYKAVKDVNFLTDEQLGKVRRLVGVYSEAKGKFNAAEVAQGALSTAMDDTTQKAKEQAAGVKGLTEEIKKLLGVNAEGTNKSNYLKELVNLKVDPKLAEMLYEARKAEGLEWGKNQVLSDAVRKSVLERWKADQGLNKTLEDRAKIEERSKKAIDAQGNAMKVNALVASNAAKANATALESAKNLPKGLLSAVNMVESPRSNFAKSGSGAGGPMQFMPPTADRYKVDIDSVESSYRGASNYLKDLLKMFDGDIESALRAYNWGEGNMQNYLKYGSGMKKENGKWQKGYFADKPMPKETREYSSKVMGYMGGASGVSFNEDYSFDDWMKEQEKLVMEREKREKEQADKQKQLALEVATYKERVNTELADKIKEVNEAGFGEAETKRLTVEYQKRAAIDIQVSEAVHADKLAEYSDYVKTEEQLVNDSFSRRQRDLKLDLTLTHDEYTQASLNLETMRKRELEAIRHDQNLELLEAKRHWVSAENYARDYYALIRQEILATSSYSPEMKQALVKEANFNQGLDQNAERENVWGDYKSMMGLDDSPYQQDMDLLAEARAQMLITEDEYYRNRANLQVQWGSSFVSGAADVMAQLFGENSKAYEAMFAVQKAMAVAQVLMNAPATYSAVLASASMIPLVGPYIAPGLAAGAVALQMAQASMIGNVSFNPAGMAHDGIDNIPKEGTWLLDKGERVVDSRTNSDLKNYLSTSKSGSGVNVNIIVPPGYIAKQSRTENGITVDIVEQIVDQKLNNVRRPNSAESSIFQEAFGLAPVR